MQQEFSTCLISGKNQTADECASTILTLSTQQIAKCQECPRGKAMVSSTPLARTLPPVTPGQPRCARELVRAATGCKSDADLAEKIKFSQPTVSLAFRMLAKGETPRGPVFAAMMRASGLTAADLLGCSPVAQPTYCAVDAKPDSETASPAAAERDPEDKPEAAAKLIGPDGKPLHVPQGDVQHDLQHPAAIMPKQEADGIPADFEPFVPLAGNPEYTPGVTLNKAQDLVINTAAVRAFGLGEVSRVRLYWSRKRGELGIAPSSAPTKAADPATMSLGRATKKRDLRMVSFKGFMRTFGLSIKSGQHFALRQEGGLLLAKIDTQPGKGGEAELHGHP